VCVSPEILQQFSLANHFQIENSIFKKKPFSNS